MKNINILSIIFSVLLLAAGCQKPHELISQREGTGINSITASFPGDDSMDNSFKGEIDTENHVINIVFPYNWPILSDEVLSEEKLKRVRMNANLENNVVIEPALLFMDLTQENHITVIDNSARTRTVYTVVSEIRKSAECSLFQFNISSMGLSGVINDKDMTISLITPDIIGEQVLASDDVIISHGAVMTPDPRVTSLDYDKDQKIRVTAQNGVDYKEYTVIKSVPAKVGLGIRGGSGTQLWVKSLKEISGITDPAKISGFAVTEDHLVINERGSKSLVYLNNKTGAVAGTMDISAIVTKDTDNWHMTADDSGNILITNMCGTNGGDGSKKLVIWKIAGVSAAPVKWIEYNLSVASAYFRCGWEISVQGSVDSDALITSQFHDGKTASFARWQVKNGALVSQTPDIVKTPIADAANYATSSWGADIIYTSSTDVNSDYFFVSHLKHSDATRYIFWCKGDEILTTGPGAPNSTIMNSVDYKEFNGGKYLIYNYVNTFTYVVTPADAVNLYDVSGGSISTSIKVCDTKIHGSQGSGNGQAKLATSDVALKVSRNGYYMYAYFIFLNGNVGCVQYDCIDM